MLANGEHFWLFGISRDDKREFAAYQEGSASDSVLATENTLAQPEVAHTPPLAAQKTICSRGSTSIVKTVDTRGRVDYRPTDS